MEQTLWQQDARLCRFDDDAVQLKLKKGQIHSNPTYAARMPSVVGTSDAVYDPSHPAADWSGMVPRATAYGKKHGGEGMRAAMSTIERTEEGGIVARPGMDVQPEPGRKHYEDDGRFQTEAQRAGQAVFGKRATGATHYETAAQAAMRGAPTPAELRGTRRPGKKMVKPAYESPSPFMAQTTALDHEARRRQLADSHRAAFESNAAPQQPASLLGYRAKELNAGAQMLSHADIARTVAMPPTKSAARWENKELFIENFAPSNAIVGYSGVRRH